MVVVVVVVVVVLGGGVCARWESTWRHATARMHEKKEGIQSRVQSLQRLTKGPDVPLQRLTCTRAHWRAACQRC
jgi:hypothetical protein